MPPTKSQYQGEISAELNLAKTNQGFARLDENELNEGPPIPPPDIKGAWRKLITYLREKL